MDDNTLNREAKKVEREILADKYKTALDKSRFINEIKSDLGKQIKENPNKAKIIKKSWSHRFLTGIKKFFTKF